MRRIRDKQPKGIALRSAYKPQEGFALSGVVKVWNKGKVGNAFIKFTDSTILALAQFMPKGVGEAHPVYLKLIITEVDTYEIWGCYLDSDEEIPIWVTEDTPKWLGKIHPQ